MNRTLQRVERSASLGAQVYELLREHLSSGRVRWGETLREADLAERLGVSRTPVREALARLASEGLIEAHGRSFTVPALTDADVEDIYQLRLLLETEAVRQAARGDAGADVETSKAGVGSSRTSEVRRALQEAEAAHAASNAEAFIRAASRFRVAWLALVRNVRLVRAVELYADHVRALQFLTLGDRRRQMRVLKGMKEILRALDRRHEDEAAVAMHRFLSIARSALAESGQTGGAASNGSSGRRGGGNGTRGVAIDAGAGLVRARP